MRASGPRLVERSDLERVPTSTGEGSARMRLLHGRDGVPEDALRPVLHRALDQTGPRGRHHQPTGLGLGDPAGPEPLDHRIPRGQAHPAPDRDSKFSGRFDEIFRTEDVRVLKTPIRAPRANAFAERWVGTARRECLDHVLIFGRRHLQRVLAVYAEHYNRERPHRALELRPPDPASPAEGVAGSRVRRRAILGGLIHEYQWIAA